MTVAIAIGEVLFGVSTSCAGAISKWAVGAMKKLDEARSEAEAILALRDDDLSRMFFRETMSRNLSRIVTRLDRLVRNGGDDKVLGKKALKRLGFSTEE